MSGPDLRDSLLIPHDVRAANLKVVKQKLLNVRIERRVDFLEDLVTAYNTDKTVRAIAGRRGNPRLRKAFEELLVVWKLFFAKEKKKYTDMRDRALKEEEENPDNASKNSTFIAQVDLFNQSTDQQAMARYKDDPEKYIANGLKSIGNQVRWLAQLEYYEKNSHLSEHISRKDLTSQYYFEQTGNIDSEGVMRVSRIKMTEEISPILRGVVDLDVGEDEGEDVVFFDSNESKKEDLKTTGKGVCSYDIKLPKTVVAYSEEYSADGEPQDTIQQSCDYASDTHHAPEECRVPEYIEQQKSAFHRSRMKTAFPFEGSRAFPLRLSDGRGGKSSMNCNVHSWRYYRNMTSSSMTEKLNEITNSSHSSDNIQRIEIDEEGEYSIFEDVEEEQKTAENKESDKNGSESSSSSAKTSLDSNTDSILDPMSIEARIGRRLSKLEKAAVEKKEKRLFAEFEQHANYMVYESHRVKAWFIAGHQHKEQAVL